MTDHDISPEEQAWTRVGSYPDLHCAHEHVLVILAMGLPCWIEVHPDSSDHHLLVSPDVSGRVQQELKQYDEENIQESPQPDREAGIFNHSPAWSLYLLWVILLVVVHRLQAIHPQLVELGASSSTGLIDEGEWWRPFTALFLHADFEHLAGNLLSGLFFSTLVASSIGGWRAWLLILGCGTLGNGVTSLLVHPDPYQSIGASTAVFAALGILSGLGLAWMLRFRGQLPWLRIIAPVIGGIIVLGMTGSGLPDSNTDVMGHVFGFVSGLVVGTLWGALGNTLNCRANSGTSKAESGART